MRFLHIADVHLGCRRYNLEERTRDFFRAWYDVIVKHVLPNKGDFALVPWNEEEGAGSYIDIAGARIFGSNWYGSSTLFAISKLADALRRASSEGRFNILMLHTDIEGHTMRPMIPALPLAKLNE